MKLWKEREEKSVQISGTFDVNDLDNVCQLWKDNAKSTKHLQIAVKGTKGT